MYTFPGYVQVGDTISVSADAFDANGYVTAALAPRLWVLSDSALVSVAPSAPPLEWLRLTGRQTGVLTLTVKIDTATGSSTLRVIPVLAPLTATPTSVSIKEGDSARVVVHVTDLRGQPVDGLIVLATPVTSGIVFTACCRDTLWVRSIQPGGKTGTTLMNVQVANDTGSFSVTVTAP